MNILGFKRCPNLPSYERTLGLRRGDCIADRIWFRGRYLAARGVGVGRKILSVMRDERRRGSSSTSAGDDVLGWWLGDGTAEYFSCGSRVARDREQLAQHRTGAGTIRGFCDNLRADEDFDRRWPSNTRFSTTRI